ncbi:hypothetical protein BASA50_003324 [Batrachochytrium salamandrivorans]|uniref:Uncharacterized protein n=1 Tax=Batrachochytrium salamandrivorans TaxID=1357716 RepID=A0ABQ8FIX3_9FUNG|nr:hypothetical protein BASA60_000345 [Batrachochytrium salamandrivorans]KAH6576683.1 hypothetical protein BASA62_001291 [Batrachochytrium salamandrivorans]KAH6585384.1 hypothetical protein BASA61_006870 [Batrachochytrium salamandrivorans]KAH6599004.1 hypothetical protein BASA50_003324 [Batrachochytrium salamandrivorans]KAH9251894.1 hypothetical protein BASA81_010214 [Batrachochytrium salamandrivorans]
MKLISFAVISFLAITVSARPPPSIDAQSLEESQSIIYQRAQRQHLRFLQIKLGEWVQDYKEKQAETGKLQDTINAMEEEESKIKLEINGLDDPEKEASAQNLSNLQISLEEVKESKKVAEDEIKVILGELQELKEEIDLLHVTHE